MKHPTLKDEYDLVGTHTIEGLGTANVYRPKLSPYQMMLRENMATEAIMKVLLSMHEQGKINLLEG